jgi:rSAM/selenodomain-associated transferase 2
VVSVVAVPLISVVVPVLSDFAAAERLVGQILPDRRIELILVDGGNDSALDRLTAARSDIVLIRSAPGRGRQMNAGAAAARGTWLLFLHADCVLPPHWEDAIARLPENIQGGWFAFALDDPSWQARMIERGVRWRVRVFHLPYGDQGLFVRQSMFADLGGYRLMALMEDVEFVRRLTARATVLELPLPLRTSARRWRRDGWFVRSARNVALVTLYFAGVSADRLARWYGPSSKVEL